MQVNSTSKANEKLWMRDKDTDKVKPSHHDLPKDPGSDYDHHHKEERERDRKRSWDEHHPNNPSRPK